jgi:6-phosphofructokinase 1
MTELTLLYAQSGGVTSVINASAVGVIRAARAAQAGPVLAARHGLLGLLNEDLVDTAALSDDDLAAMCRTPGGLFGSSRLKLPEPEDDERPFKRLAELVDAHGIDVLLYNGGNDSADTCLKVARYAQAQGLALRCIAIPKTIDNDLMATDCCPGYGSVANYVATSIMEASLDVRSMAANSTRVFILEVMGRHTGWIAAAGGYVALRRGPAPQLLLLPERPFDAASFTQAVDQAVQRDGYCAVVAAEGVRDVSGALLADSGTVDAFGHSQLGGVAPRLAQLVGDQLGHKCHWAVSDYLQRSARHLASAVDLQQAEAVGAAAVELALAGETAVMVVIERLSDAPYRWQVGHADLSQIANRERLLPDDFIRADGYGITEAAASYLQGLIGMVAPLPLASDGLPDVLTDDRLPIMTARAKQLPPWSKV